MRNYSRKRLIHQLAMRFSDGGAQPPAADPAPTPAPAVDPPASDPVDDPAPIDPAEVEQIRKQLEAANKAKKAAEDALVAEKRESSKLKRAQMTDAELLSEQKKEMEEKARMYDRQMSAITAEKILVGAGLTGDDYEDLLNFIVSEDAEKTESAAQAIVDILERQKFIVAKSEREKILKETPAPPAGGGATEISLNDQMHKMLYG